MDIKDRVAARRAELERQQQATAAAIKAEKQAALAAATAERHAALNVETNKILDSLPDRRLREDTDFAAPPSMPVAGMKHRQLQALLTTEARKRWSQEDKWMVFGPLGAGVLLLPFVPLLSAIILGFAGWRWNNISWKYEKLLLDTYPGQFGTALARTPVFPMMV